MPKDSSNKFQFHKGTIKTVCVCVCVFQFHKGTIKTENNPHDES